MEKKKRIRIREHSRGYPFYAYRGKVNRLEVTFEISILINGEMKVYNPLEPDTPPKVTIIDPSGKIAVSNAQGQKSDRGMYYYDLNVPPDAEKGTWQDVWKTTLKGHPVKEIWKTHIADPPPFGETIMYDVYSRKRKND